MNKNLLLIIPNSNKWRKNYNRTYSLGIPYVSSIAKQCGWNSDILNLNFVEGYGEAQIKAKLAEKQYDIVGTGGNVFEFEAIKKIIEITKRIAPSIPTLIGGRLVFSDGEIVMKEVGAEYGIIGDVDVTFPLFLEKIASRSNAIIPNMLINANGGG